MDRPRTERAGETLLRELRVVGVAWEREVGLAQDREGGETILRELRVAGVAWEREVGLAQDREGWRDLVEGADGSRCGVGGKLDWPRTERAG